MVREKTELLAAEAPHYGSFFFRDFFPRLGDMTFQENPYDELAISAV